jgi:DNA replication protein DnaC
VCLHAGHGATNLGSGKTHALIATAREWIERGTDPRYYLVAEIVNRHRLSFGDESVNPPDVGGREDLVLLDDLGAEASTSFTVEIVDRIVDERYRRGYPTLIATNLSLAELEARYRRVADRLHEGRLLEWEAPSWRRL